MFNRFYPKNIDNLNRVLDNIKQFLAKVRRYYTYLFIFIEKSWYDHLYEAPIRPLELIYVNPNKIRYRSEASLSGSFIRESRRTTIVKGGDWDQNLHNFVNNDLMRQSFHNHFINNIAWEDTEWYNKVEKNIKSDPSWSKWGCKNLNDFKKRCDLIDQLYYSIRNEGYQRQEILIDKNDKLYDGFRSKPHQLYEVTINITREGCFLFHEGRHRLFIAQILQLEQIPVRVKARHKKWQSIRDKLYTDPNGVVFQTVHHIKKHPDIVILLRD